MEGRNEQLEFLKQIASRLNGAEIRYMLTGSMAMAVYALPRMTRDIDIVIECELEDADKICGLFEADCYVDHEKIRNAVSGQSLFNIIHNEWVVKADFIVRKDEDYRKVEFSRRRVFQVEGSGIYVTAPEDLIISKLLWSKDASSELHFRARPLLRRSSFLNLL